MKTPTWPAFRKFLVDRHEIKPPALDDRLRDRGMDSLDQYELGYGLEEEYGVSFDDPEITGWTSFRDVFNALMGKLGKPPAEHVEPEKDWPKPAAVCPTCGQAVKR